MILENPAPVVNIGVQDILGILERTLHEKNWRNFELANLKLVYMPHYIFNYDILIAQEVEGQTFSQGSSGIMAMNGLNGKLEPLLNQLMEEQPINYEKEITHDLQYEIQAPAVKEKEVHDSAALKLAGQFSVKKENVSISGVRLVYWPVWRIFVSLPKKTQRVDIEAVAGVTLNYEEVPAREKGWIEVTKDTLGKMKSAKGWSELSKGAARAGKGTMKAAITKSPEQGSKSQGAVHWLIHSKSGQYTLILIILLALVLLLSFEPIKSGSLFG